MSKIVRYAGNLRAFGSDAQGLERTVFGGTAQADDLTSQVTASFLRGWGIVGPSENPSLEDFNAAMYAMSQFIAYQHQMGVPEWDALQEYYAGSLCVRAGETYSSLADGNIGSAPPSAKWTPVLTSKNGLANLGLTEALDGKQPLAAALTILAKLTLVDNKPHLILNKQDMGTGGNLEGARFITYGGTSGNRQFGLGITTPTAPSGNTYGQLFYTDPSTTAGWQFDQNGHARCATAGGSWDNASDIRIKYKKEPISNALEKMMMLEGCTWLFRENDAFGMGLIAQDVEAIFPEAVNKSSYTTATGEVIPDLLSLNAGNVIAAIAPEAFREMNAMIDELKNEVASMKEEIETLKTNKI